MNESIAVVTMRKFPLSPPPTTTPKTPPLGTHVKLVNHASVNQRPMPNLTLSNEQVIDLFNVSSV
jgi:hypothetical protein